MALAISKKIVEIPGIKIWENSQFGNASAFHFTIKRQI